MDRMRRFLNIQYALIQGLYWMGFGVAFSFAAVYLQYRGYSNSYLGMVMAGGNVAALILSPLLAELVDKKGRGSVIACLWLLLSAQVCAVAVVMNTSGSSVLASLCYGAYLALIICVNPLNTQLCFEMEKAFCPMNYGAARGFGSVAYAPFVFALGILCGKFTPGMLPIAGLLLLVAQIILLLITTVQFSGRKPEDRAGNGKAGAEKGSSIFLFISGNRRFCLMLLGVALLFFAHNIVNNFMINVVRNVGGDEADVGSVNGFMAVMEIPAMFMYDRLMRRFSCPATVRFAAAMFAVKALCIAAAPSLTALIAAHTLQAFSFAVITPALVRYVDLYIDRRDSAKGQSLAYAMTTLGSIFASSIGGIMYDMISVRATLVFGVLAAAAGAVMCAAFTRHRRDMALGKEKIINKSRTRGR